MAKTNALIGQALGHVTIPEAITERGRGGFPKENRGAVTWKGKLDCVWANTTDRWVSVDMLSEQTTRKISASEESWFGGSSLRHADGKLSLVFSNSRVYLPCWSGVRELLGMEPSFDGETSFPTRLGASLTGPGGGIKNKCETPCTEHPCRHLLGAVS